MSNTEPLRLVVPRFHVEAAAKPSTVLLVLRDPRLSRSVMRVLRASNLDIVTCSEPSTAAAWLERSDLDMVVFDYDLVASDTVAALATLEALRTHPRARPLILLCQKQDTEELAELLAQPHCGNLVAKLGELDNGDLLVTARKILENDIFGIEKYLRWGSVIHTHRVSSSTARHGVLRQFEAFLGELQCRSRFIGQMLTVADELMMNALYDAPVDASGRHLHAHWSRSQAVTLPEAQAAVIEFGSDGRFVAIGCRDPFGSLDPDTARASLARALRRGADQVRTTAGGAGIGLYMIFQYVSHMVINVDQGRATEFLGVVDLTTTARERHDQARSFNVFVKR